MILPEDLCGLLTELCFFPRNLWEMYCLVIRFIKPLFRFYSTKFTRNFIWIHTIAVVSHYSFLSSIIYVIIAIIVIVFPSWFLIVIVIFCVICLICVDIICVSSFLLVFTVDCVVIAVSTISCFVWFGPSFLCSQLCIGVYCVLIARLLVITCFKDIRKNFELLREGFLRILFDKTAHVLIDVCLILLILQMMQDFCCIFFKFISIFTKISTK